MNSICSTALIPHLPVFARSGSNIHLTPTGGNTFYTSSLVGAIVSSLRACEAIQVHRSDSGLLRRLAMTGVFDSFIKVSQ